MWVTKMSKFVLLLTLLGQFQAVAAEAHRIAIADFCNLYADSCLGGQTPSLPLLVIRDQQGRLINSHNKAPELHSDDPQQMLLALQRLLQSKPELAAQFFLPADKTCFSCRIWYQAVHEWQTENAALGLQLVEVGSP